MRYEVTIYLCLPNDLMKDTVRPEAFRGLARNSFFCYIKRRRKISNSFLSPGLLSLPF